MRSDYSFDRKRSTNLERTYLQSDIVGQRKLFRSLLDLSDGMHVLDVGSGPGLLITELAADVAPSGSVTGIEPSTDMLEISARRCAGLTKAGKVALVRGEATALPFADGSFDLVTSTQVMEYVADIGRAISETRRVLSHSGRVAILDTDWDSLVWHSTDRAMANRIYAAWEEHVAHPHLPQVLARQLVEGGFSEVECRVIPLMNLALTPEVFSFSTRRNIHAFVPGRAGVSQAEADAWLDDLETQAREGNYFFSLNRYVFLARVRAD